MNIIEAIILGIIEGLTEFLPISSTGHLTIAEKLFNFKVDSPDITAFTAIIQVGAIAATLIYFRQDILRIVTAWIQGIVDPSKRGSFDYRFGWSVLLGSIPIGIVGLVFKDQIETSVRSLWIVAIALIVWSGVLWLADQSAKQNRHEKNTTWKDTVIMGLAQCIALIPGVSRSGATMSAGLLRGLDRVAVTRLSFFLAIPALCAAGLLELTTKAEDISNGVGWTNTIVATIVSFIVAYLTIGWLLRFVAKHTYTVFIVYRVIVGLILIVLLATGILQST